MKENKEKLSARNIIGHSSANISYGFAQFVVTFILYYATENLAIAVGTVSAMIVIVKVLDAFTDLIAGVLIDKTKSKHGKVRPWFLWASVPYGICLALTFCISPNFSGSVKVILLGIMYALTVSVFGTVVGVAKVALVSRVSKDPGNRSVMGVVGDTIGGLCVGLGMTVTLPMANAMGWSMTFVVFGIVAFATCILCFLITKEYEDEVEEALEEKQSTSIKNIFGVLFRNKYSLLLLILVILVYMGMGIMQTGGTYYFQYVLGDLNLFTITMGISMVAGIIGIFIAAPIMKKFGNRNAMILAFALVIVGYIFILIAGKSNGMITAVALAVISALVTCFAIGGFTSMAAMTVDYGEYKTGIRTEGISSSVVNIGVKIGNALAAALLGAVMASGGFVEGGAGVQSEETVKAITGAYLYVPMVIFVVVLVLILFVWKLDKEYPAICDRT